MIAARKAQVSRIKTIGPKTGRNRYRLLPGWRVATHPEADQFWHDFGQHYIKDPLDPLKKKIKAVALCTDKTYGRACAICATLAQASKMNPSDDELYMIKEATAGGRVLLNVLELDGPTPDVPQILNVPPSVFNGAKGVGGIISLFAEWPNLLNIETGNDIVIEKSGTGMDTRYGVQVAGASKPVPASVMTKINDLDKFVAEEAAGMDRALLALGSAVGIAPQLGAPAQNLALPGVGGFEDVPETFVSGVAAVASAPVAAPVAAPVFEAQATTLITPVAAPVAVAPVAVAPVAVAAAPVAEMVSTGDPELDALLRDIK